MTKETEAFIESQIQAMRLMKAELARGPWWHFRDSLARGLHWLAIRIEPPIIDRRREK
jgi:hypothetical protein